tara:strand:+ start:199 stop:456 length:258 start_codon:yes stop_codon:yes gene_type:complete
MSQIIKLEKRFENALEKLELALAKNNLREPSESSKKEEVIMKGSQNNIDDLLEKIDHLEKAAKNDANEIDKLVRKLEEIFELEHD